MFQVKQAKIVSSIYSLRYNNNHWLTVQLKQLPDEYKILNFEIKLKISENSLNFFKRKDIFLEQYIVHKHIYMIAFQLHS